MKRLIGWLGIIVIAAGAFYFWRESSRPEPQLIEPAPAPAPPAAQAEPAIRYPMPQNEDPQAAPQPLPALEQSDQAMWDALAELLGSKQLKTFFYPQEIVRHIVVTIDNLPRKTVATRVLPVKPVDGKFLVAGQGDSLAIAPDNAARYTPYVRIAEMADAKKLVAVYTRFYPLFQRAYQDLGYPNGYFNDRLVAVIDHLLAAPQPDELVALVQPHVLYRFADPELQAASAGHKILLRMGRENAAKVQAKLREIRRELIGGSLERQ